MNKIIVVVSNDNECIESLKRAGDSIGVEIKYEIQSQGKIINELSINDIKESTAVLFAIDGEVEDVEKIERFIDCEYYEVDSLTHSIPYLVPKAKDLLETIGRSFIDSLESRGGGSYQILVTSVLRVDQDVKRLRKKNGNASANSAHRYGTTFDIAYSRFVTTDDRYLIPKEQLKHILAEVLLSLKKRNACYVKYEIKQGCFHVTVR